HSIDTRGSAGLHVAHRSRPRGFSSSLIYNLTRTSPGAYVIEIYKSTALIYNPRAGRILRSSGDLIRRTEQALREFRHNLTRAPKTRSRPAGAIARSQIERGADLVVVAGGDGTVNEALEGMIGSGVPLAVLPAGTANVLAMEMKLGRDPVAAARRIGE